MEIHDVIRKMEKSYPEAVLGKRKKVSVQHTEMSKIARHSSVTVQKIMRDKFLDHKGVGLGPAS